ncbi:MAG: hypothetical protein IJV08_09250 [Bacteroidaceae bacterium]|nr:hypothetical protein [Bacteroidaceae bacterium]
MKKLFAMMFAALAFSASMNAQDAPIGGDGFVTDGGDEKEAYCDVTLGYYAFKDFGSVGLAVRMMNPNSIGFDFGYRMHFDPFTWNMDFGLNYSYCPWSKGRNMFLVGAAVGPSLGMRDVYKVNNKGNVSKESKVFCDGFIDPRLTFKAGSFTLGAGYMVWLLKWQDVAKGGFHVNLGVAF